MSNGRISERVELTKAAEEVKESLNMKKKFSQKIN